MNHPRARYLFSSAVAAFLAAGCSGDPKPAPVKCVGTEVYFRDTAWPQVFSACAQCHVAGGQASGTRFTLKTPAVSDYISQSIQAVRYMMAFEQDGKPLLVLKPTMTVPHGGGLQIPVGSDKQTILEETIERLKNPVICPGDGPKPVTEGVTFADAYGTLRKASWQLVGRPSTPAEVTAIDADGLAGLDNIIKAQMKESAFEERLREIFSDVLLTDGFRAGNTINATSIVAGEYYPQGSVDHWGGADWDTRSWPNGEGIRLVEALAREPVEFVVQAVRANRPLSDILTAKHRLLNAYSARFFKVPYKGFAPGTNFDMIPNPQEYVPIAGVPGINEVAGSGEYAGIFTTSAFLLRYPSSPTNFNRKRARFTYKYFLNFDIMQQAPRIDASAVDLNDFPTRKNPQCTGCHEKLDPVAGMFMNQDECGYDAAVFYQPPGSPKDNACSDQGWAPSDHVFPPGVAPGDSNVLAAADRPKALEKLAAYIVTQPGFVEAMVSHVYVGLMGRPLLKAPTDPNMPNFAMLDAAYNAEQTALADFAKTFSDGGLMLEPLVIAIVKSDAFRAIRADDPTRMELLGLGGGKLTTTEILNRKIQSVTGFPWRHHLADVPQNSGYQPVGPHDGSGEAYLLLRTEMKTLYGGIDGSFDGVKVRSRLPSTLTAAIVENMALGASCESVTRDFDKPVANRKLFPLVAPSLVPNGNAASPEQAPIIDNIRYLHEMILGERLEANDPEILATYQLLVDAHDDGVAAGAPPALERPCANDMNLATGEIVNGGTTEDPQYVIRAWQAVVAYMLMDYRFVFEQ